MFESVQKRAAAFTRDGLKVRRLIDSCKKLLSERGEAAGVSLAKTTLDRYGELDIKEQARFFSAIIRRRLWVIMSGARTMCCQRRARQSFPLGLMCSTL